MINGNNSYWQNASMNIRKDEDEWRLAKDTVPAPSELGSKDITENGNYLAKDDGLDGYSDVSVSVSNSYTSEDEGKVVDNGELVAQTAMQEEVTENGTINTTLYNSVTVNVSGGEGGSSGGDVIFYDYDGSVVASYSAADFAALTAMPENPTHDGLTAQGWNWTLTDAKAHVASYGKLNIGQMYITSDGKTRFYFTVTKDSLTTELTLSLNEDTELDVDWGDGSTHTIWTGNDGDSYKTHEYASAGRYVIVIEVITGEFYLSSALSNIYKIEIGNGVVGMGPFYNCYSLSSVTIPDGITSISDYAFQDCYSLSSVTIPDGVTSIDDYAFQNCSSLSSVTIPGSVTSIGSAFQYCYSLLSVTIPDSVTSIGSSAFSDCYALSSITIPDGVTSISDSVFYQCYSLSSVTIPNGVTSINSDAFRDCHALSSIIIPDGVTSISIGSSAFEGCNALLSVTFESSTPPNLDSDLGIPYTCIIRVPQGSLSAYTSASNYPDPSQYIYEEY